MLLLALLPSALAAFPSFQLGIGWPRDSVGPPKDAAAPRELSREFHQPSGQDAIASENPVANALEELHYALETMQTTFFELWLGTWPDSIDWTGAVLGTFVSASLNSLTRSLDYALPPTAQSEGLSLEGQKVENEINKYFSQSVAYYFGENAVEIRFEAFDDMLWVVLGWLENVRFIKLHTKAHYSAEDFDSNANMWYGEQFTPAFAHRAHVFYDLASNGWDTRLCGGGMNWNPYLEPYKNAITNELFISASIGMYLHFPGDCNRSPFGIMRETNDQRVINCNLGTQMLPPAGEHDARFLKSAIDAYEWLKHSNMTNAQGLYVDGFHIGKGAHKCDVRNEMVYTYNQGVLLSGLRSLWESTGNVLYLQDGHELVRNVLNATGWDMETSLPDPRQKDRWRGIGRNGILEELCDSKGDCSQNGQTFKGMFFHHLTHFCERLPREPVIPGVSFGADKETEALHRQSCKEYAAWVVHNAVQAMATRDGKGRFGMWWGAPSALNSTGHVEQPLLPRDAVDYRNCHFDGKSGKRWGPLYELQCNQLSANDELRRRDDIHGGDLNDRGRGRTVETQGGGVAVVRAMWEFVNRYGSD